MSHAIAYSENTITIQRNWQHVPQDEEKAKQNRRTDHRFYAEIVTDITTRNSESKDT
jgi:hypothetical protein